MWPKSKLDTCFMRGVDKTSASRHVTFISTFFDCFCETVAQAVVVFFHIFMLFRLKQQNKGAFHLSHTVNSCHHVLYCARVDCVRVHIPDCSLNRSACVSTV